MRSKPSRSSGCPPLCWIVRIVRQQRGGANHAGQFAWELRPICRPSRRSARKWISAPTSTPWPWWRTCWCTATCHSSESPASSKRQTGNAAAPASARKIPRDVADAILAGLERNPADRPASAIAFARRFHNAVDAEFLALRRSKAFLLQHLMAYALLMIAVVYRDLDDLGPSGGLQRENPAGAGGANRAGAAGGGDSFSFFPITCFARPRR